MRCGPGYFQQNSSHCSACHPSCHSCVGPGDTDCARCEGNSLYFSRRCVPYCPAGYTADSGGAECQSCPLGCDSCSRPAHCQSCSPGWTAQDGLCSPPPPQLCQPGLYRGGGTCLACHSNCRTCSGSGEEDCTSCYSDHKQFRSACRADCPPGEFSDLSPLSSLLSPLYCNIVLSGSFISGQGNSCISCPHSCKTCDGRNCDSCQPRYFLQVRTDCSLLTGQCLTCSEPGWSLCRAVQPGLLAQLC